MQNFTLLQKQKKIDEVKEEIENLDAGNDYSGKDRKKVV